METHSNLGASAPLTNHVYTVANTGTLSPVLIDRLGPPGAANLNRLILSAALHEMTETVRRPAPSPPTGLPLLDWQIPPLPTGNAVLNSPDEEGGRDALSH